MRVGEVKPEMVQEQGHNPWQDILGEIIKIYS